MTRKNFATCCFFETEKCPNVFSRTMQKVFSPGSVYKGSSKNIADVENIRQAIDMCASCKHFKPRKASAPEKIPAALPQQARGISGTEKQSSRAVV